MESYQIKILNPKAVKLLEDLADLNLISFKRNNENEFLKIIDEIRKKAGNPPSLEEITNEVEVVRAERYESKKK